MAPRWSRRTWLGGAAAVAGVATTGMVGRTLLARFQERSAAWRPGPFGALRPDPQGVLDLPEGFVYRVLDRQGAPMEGGFVVPERPDGMACFALDDGRWALMRNHENPLGVPLFGPSPGRALPPEAFDPQGTGGVSRVVVDPVTLERISANLVLAGTGVNCAGGTSPWGWLSCEETVDPNHGFVFVCDPNASELAPAQPIRGYGRFRHEAAVVDPATSIAYLTEDREDGCIYRFVPHDPERPFEGELFAMRVRGRDGMETRTELARNPRVEIDWVRIDESNPQDDVVRRQAVGAGAARIARGEGMTLLHRDPSARPSVIVCASIGGPNALGQILELIPDGDGGELSLLASSAGPTDLEMPDNITAGPAGRLYLCEDGDGRDYVRGLDPHTGELFDFARNAQSDGEIAGVCFSPDGTAMFLNLQQDGMTLAIRGPFV